MAAAAISPINRPHLMLPHRLSQQAIWQTGRISARSSPWRHHTESALGNLQGTRRRCHRARAKRQRGVAGNRSGFHASAQASPYAHSLTCPRPALRFPWVAVRENICRTGANLCPHRALYPSDYQEIETSIESPSVLCTAAL
jgi:hypothetical protein